jgi:hypothetical protein
VRFLLNHRDLKQWFPLTFVAFVVPIDLCGLRAQERREAAPAHVDPAAIDFDAIPWRGDFAIRVPALKPDCRTGEDPVTHIRCVGDNGATARGLIDGVVFTPSFGVYPREARHQIYDAYAGRGYTMFPVHIPCTPDKRGYHSIYPPPDCSGAALNSLLRELYDHKPMLVPVCAVLDDPVRPEPAAGPEGYAKLDLPDGFDRSLCRVGFGQWERPQADCQLKAARAAFPAMRLYWENPGHASSPEPDPCSPSAFPTGRAWFTYARHAYGLRGVLAETDYPNDVGAAIRFLARAREDWRDMDVRLFETDIYQKFWDNRGEQESLRYNNAILAAHPWLQGFTSGGTVSPRGIQ